MKHIKYIFTLQRDWQEDLLAKYCLLGDYRSWDWVFGLDWFKRRRSDGYI
ncbi:hypothetical protein PPNSA23_12170 [Phyllobacterium phragmitis]|uniref:Uncharacterized protein n=1 Tax=Phyllobacterium phragmitis TaxID=2670329 RepID=A0ABQ0GX73_9HYPH